jgi:predicted GNAT superfamily acetyltransferase
VNYTIRDLENAFDMDALEDIQKAAWNYGDREVMPGSMLSVSAHSGGIVAAAYPEGSNDPVGFVYGIPAVRPADIRHGKLIHHSHMLAIVPEHRGSGLARALKLHQRNRALEMGYDLMTWTMDPLLSKNARLNLGKLSARAVSYHNDWYAIRGGIYAGLSADRFMIEWVLNVDPLERPVPDAQGARLLEARDGDPRHGPDVPETGLEADVLLIEVPRDIDGLKRDNMPAARAWREAHRVAFPDAFGRGYIATDLAADGERLFYRLERPDQRL